MEVIVEEISALTRKLTITLPEGDVQKKLTEAYDKLQKESKMKGFRRGKVPRSIIVKSYKPQVEGEVGEKLVQDTYFEALEKEKIDPVVHPEISAPVFGQDGTFTYVAHVDIKPDFELKDYKGIEVEKPDITVAEEEIDRELQVMQKNMAALRTVDDRPIQKGDVIVIDYQGYHKDNAIKQVKNENFSLEVGSGKMGPEFEEKLVGMQKGQEASHQVDFPEKHPNPILAGKKVDFRVSIKDVQERVLAELDDEFAKDVGKEFNTLDELKNAIRDRSQKKKNEAADGELIDRIMQKLLKNNEFEVPKRLVRFEVEEMIKQTEQQFEKSGMTLEAAGLSKQMLAENNEPMAMQRVRGDFILKKIAEIENIKVNDEDMDRGFKRIGDQYNMPVAKVKEFFQHRDDLLPFMNEMLNEKVLHFLREQARIVEPAATAVEEKKEEEGSAQA
ncbi:MAG: trigger factor [Desulfocapsaceae bacterium]|nr:trigger factor [Desulfocapsaceae bacterium]